MHILEDSAHDSINISRKFILGAIFSLFSLHTQINLFIALWFSHYRQEMRLVIWLLIQRLYLPCQMIYCSILLFDELPNCQLRILFWRVGHQLDVRRLRFNYIWCKFSLRFNSSCLFIIPCKLLLNLTNRIEGLHYYFPFKPSPIPKLISCFSFIFHHTYIQVPVLVLYTVHTLYYLFTY